MLSLIVKLLELQLARKHNGDWEKNQLHARHACPELLARCSKIVKKINCITELFACIRFYGPLIWAALRGRVTCAVQYMDLHSHPAPEASQLLCLLLPL
jgi:hypothetical protein